MSNKAIQSIRGMNDQLPDVCDKWQTVEQLIREIVRLYGYREIRTPILEKTELFSRSIGEQTDIVEKEMYTFADRNQDSLTLRPEATASCVRAGIEHGLLYNQTQRLWYLGPMFRHERPQRGRYRQFHQFGIEALGWPGPDIDAEIISLGTRLWRRLGLAGVRLEINTLGSPTSRARYLEDLRTFLEKHHDELDESSRRRLTTNPLRILDSKDSGTKAILDDGPNLEDYLDDEDQHHFDLLLEHLEKTGVEYHVNRHLVRGLDYYTGAVYEWTTQTLGAQNAFCGGGRYDGLVQQLGGPTVPAAGFACGMERLVELYDQQRSTTEIAGAEVWMVMLGDAAEAFGYPLAEKLREAGIEVVCNCGGGTIAKQLRRADQNGARFAVIIGDEELCNQRFKVKPLQSREEQSSMAEERLADFFLAQRNREQSAH
jgi:histidyl-tRNA synthetase